MGVNAFLAHIDLVPLIYGVLMFVGIAYIWHNMCRLRLLRVVTDCSVFWLVFSLHGHSMTGGFAAMIAALLASLFFPMIARRAFK